MKGRKHNLKIGRVIIPDAVRTSAIRVFPSVPAYVSSILPNRHAQGGCKSSITTTISPVFTLGTGLFHL